MNFSFFPNYKNRTKAIEDICKKYPFVNRKIIGHSLCDRPIDLLQLGNQQNPVLFACAFHGMEWLTTLLLLRFFNDCCDSVENKTKIKGYSMFNFLKKKGIALIPCVNPDGVEISLCGSLSSGKYKSLVSSVCKNTAKWQSNARGVDLNHNFDAGWQELKRAEIKSGITSPSPTRYGGEKPFSEPETICLAELCEKSRFRHAVAFHSQGREIYYDFGKSTPQKSYKMARLMSKVSGYKMSQPQGLAVGGGFKDWFIENFERPAFTVEVGLGKNPLPVSMLDSEYGQILEMLCLLAIM